MCVCPKSFGPICVLPQHHTQNSWHSWRKKLQHSPACSWHMVAKRSRQSKAPKQTHTHTHQEDPRTPCTLCRADEHVHVITEEKKRKKHIVCTVNVHTEPTEQKRSRCTKNSRSRLVWSQITKRYAWHTYAHIEDRNTRSCDARVHEWDSGWGDVEGRGGGHAIGKDHGSTWGQSDKVLIQSSNIL